MRRLLKWWRSQKWTYIGYTKYNYTITNTVTGDKTEDERVLHFYVWEADNKQRKIEFPYNSREKDALFKSTVYQSEVVPWLEGGDMWKPITHKVAVKGNLINYVGNQP